MWDMTFFRLQVLENKASTFNTSYVLIKGCLEREARESSTCGGWRGKEDASSSATSNTEWLKHKLWKVIYIAHVKLVPLWLLRSLKTLERLQQYVQILLLTPHGKSCCYTGTYFPFAVFAIVLNDWCWRPTWLVCCLIFVKKGEKRVNFCYGTHRFFTVSRSVVGISQM